MKRYHFDILFLILAPDMNKLVGCHLHPEERELLVTSAVRIVCFFVSHTFKDKRLKLTK